MKIGITERGDAALDQTWRKRLHQVDGVVLITKAPQSLGEIPEKAIVHCTITGFGGSVLEPGVAKPEVTLAAYKRILAEIGPERCVLRIDPIIPTEKGLKAALSVFRHAGGRVRISFMDNYNHLQNRFRQAGIPQLPLKNTELHFPLSVRKAALAQFPGAEVCGEPGLPTTGCISNRDLAALGLPETGIIPTRRQRGACQCIEGKTELLGRRGQCPHRCLYCYWT